MTLRQQFEEMFWSNPFMAVALLAAGLAFATTPIAFVFLGNSKWFAARRGRTLQRPAFWSVVCSMLLVMGVPAIFLAMVVKSQYFDKDRYEFDPNRTLSVVDQGRIYETRGALDSVYKLDEAVRAEQKRLEVVRKDLEDGVKRLDAAMLTLREAARRNPDVVPAMNDALERLGGIRKAVGIDAPQQLIDLKAEPAALANAPKAETRPTDSAYTRRDVPPPSKVVAAASNGLSRAEIDAMIAAVPEPQKPIAAMLPLADVPDGFIVAKIPGKAGAQQYVETFNADNLFEKLDGRAESFIQNAVKGMACCSYHPKGDPESEVQLFVFEMGNPLKARGKFDSEKPEEDAKPLTIGNGAYAAAGSVFVHADRFYTIVNVAQDDPKLRKFAEEVARKVAATQQSSKSSGPTMEDLFKLFPTEPKRSGEKYVAQDVFGYSFLADVFLADFEAGDVKFQGFLRPYGSPEEAKKVFDTYVETARKDGAKLKEIADSGADKMVLSDNIGLVDVVFLKGNAVGGANGSTVAKPAEAFAREFAKGLPAVVPIIAGGESKAEKPADGAEK